MVARYLTFAEQNDGVYMPHDEKDEYRDTYGQRSWSDRWLEDDYKDAPDSWNDLLSDLDRGDVYADNPDLGAFGDDPDAPDWVEYPSLAEIDRAIDA
jgi:hypothetical protein